VRPPLLPWSNLENISSNLVGTNLKQYGWQVPEVYQKHTPPQGDEGDSLELRKHLLELGRHEPEPYSTIRTYSTVRTVNSYQWYTRSTLHCIETKAKSNLENLCMVHEWHTTDRVSVVYNKVKYCSVLYSAVLYSAVMYSTSHKTPVAHRGACQCTYCTTLSSTVD